METVPKTKPWYLSKTLWTNLLLGVIVVAVPKAGEYLSVENLAMIFAVVNMVLRVVTKDKLEIS